MLARDSFALLDDSSRSPEVVAEWTADTGESIVVHSARGTVCCDPLVAQLLDAVAPMTPDPAGGLRPLRRYLLDVDGRDHIVLVASMIEGDRLVPIALARCVRLAIGSRIAAPSLVVRDDMRGRGIGTRLLATLGAVARACEIDRFRVDGTRQASTLQLMRHGGFRSSTVVHGFRPLLEISLAEGPGSSIDRAMPSWLNAVIAQPALA